MITLRDNSDVLTIADLVDRLGTVPLDRIRFRPAPGTAVEQDVLDLRDREHRLFELVDGVLVEKPMGYVESLIAALLVQVLRTFTENADLGIVAGPDGMMRIGAGLVRMPDVSVVLWNRLPGRTIPRDPIPSLAPDLAVEVLSPSNTTQEMGRKVAEYFAAGCSLVWLVDSSSLSVRVYTSEKESVLLTGDDLISGEPVLAGFQISVGEIFKRAGIQQ
jgi:Uma2 family endonuclease